MSSKNYWREREERQRKLNIKNEAEYQKKLDDIYADMLENIEKEINGFYVKYAKSEGITMAEAKKRISEIDIEAYAKKAKRYVKNKDLSKKANDEMRYYNAAMKINRLELLKANIGMHLVGGYDELEKIFGDAFTQRTEEEMRKQAGILGKTIQNNGEKAEVIVNASYKNATWSERIWAHQSMLKSEIDKLLQEGLIQGKHPSVLARHLEKRFGVSASNAMRLMVTELARVQTEAQKQSFIQNGFEEYEYIACEKADACNQCRSLDGKVFKVEDMMPGENAPPMHPYCHCSTAAHMDDNDYEKWLDTYSEHGLDFDTWKQLNVTESANIECLRKGSNHVLLDEIKSDHYGRKFNKITKNSAVNNSVRKYSRAILTHRNGTDGEDLYIISAKTGKRLFSKTKGANELGVELSLEEIKIIKQYANVDGIIGIHNHPTNILPTGSDFVSAGARGYEFGIVATHDGRVFLYKTGNKPFRSAYFNQNVDKYVSAPYNYDIEKAQIKTLSEFGKEFGIVWRELT